MRNALLQTFPDGWLEGISCVFSQSLFYYIMTRRAANVHFFTYLPLYFANESYRHNALKILYISGAYNSKYALWILYMSPP